MYFSRIHSTTCASGIATNIAENAAASQDQFRYFIVERAPKRKWPWATIRVGEKTRTDSAGKVTKGWDHDRPAQTKITPLGILVLVTGALTLIFGMQETS